MTGSPRDELRVVIAEDSVLLREGMVRLLTEAGIDVVGQAGDAEDLLRKVRAHKPDVAVIDVRMPPTKTTEGIEAALTIRNELPDVGLLVLSQDVEQKYAVKLFANDSAGIGYLLKDRVQNVEDFVEALWRVSKGGTPLDPKIVAHLFGRDHATDPVAALTGRERDVLALMAEGQTNRAISDRLFISIRSVEQHVTRVFHKLELDASPKDHRRVLAVLAYLQSQ